MTGQEVRKLTDQELAVELRRLRTRMHTLRTQVVTEKVEDVSQFRKTRTDVARLLTERNARSKAGAKPAATKAASKTASKSTSKKR